MFQNQCLITQEKCHYFRTMAHFLPKTHYLSGLLVYLLNLILNIFYYLKKKKSRAKRRKSNQILQIKTKGLSSRERSLPGRPSLLSDSSSAHDVHRGICREPASRLQTSLRLIHGHPGCWVLPSGCGYTGVKAEDESEQLRVRRVWSRDV